MENQAHGKRCKAIAIYYPDKDVILVTTADVQGRQGGVQLIYDAFYEEVYSHIDACTYNGDNSDYEEFQKFENSRQLLVQPGEYMKEHFSILMQQEITSCISDSERMFFRTSLIIISNVVQAQLSEQTIIFLSKCRLLTVL